MVLILLFLNNNYVNIFMIKELFIMDSKQVILFDSNNNLVSNFDEEVDKILTQVHGQNYYDIDEPIENTNLMSLDRILVEEETKEEELDKTMEIGTSMVTEDAPNIKIVSEKDKKKITFLDFIPLLICIALFVGLLYGGHYLFNNFDLRSLLTNR
jgi:hypothetical protein